MRALPLVRCLLTFLLLSLQPRIALAGDERCSDSVPERRAFFGDRHGHTAYSLDGATAGTPESAYQYAKTRDAGRPPLEFARLPRPFGASPSLPLGLRSDSILQKRLLRYIM